jgi:uncharacterized protein (DUF4415 family)
MKPKPISKPLKTVKRSKPGVRANTVREPECPYDADDAGSVAAFWAKGTLRLPGVRGPQKLPPKTAVTVRYSPEVLEFFKSSGAGWQTRMNSALLEFVKAKRQR